MADRADCGPAFPEPKWTRVGEQEIGESKPGMTLRDWFAGQALVGLSSVQTGGAAGALLGASAAANGGGGHGRYRV